MNKDYYSILGIDKSADNKTIKKKFRELAKIYHPDINKEEGATEKFKEIQEAYDVLSDEEKRFQYDNYSNVGYENIFNNNYQNYNYSSNTSFRVFNLKEWFSSLSLIKKILLILVILLASVVIVYILFWVLIIWLIIFIIRFIFNLILGRR